MRIDEDRLPAVTDALPHNALTRPLVGGSDCGELAELLPGQVPNRAFSQAAAGFGVPTFQAIRADEDRLPAVTDALPHNVPVLSLVGGADCGELAEFLPGQIAGLFRHNITFTSPNFVSLAF